MAFLTLFYLIVAFYNLGGFDVPKTSWKPVSPGEYFVVDLGGPKDLSKIYYYSGHGEGSYSVEYRDSAGKFVPLTFFKVSDFYAWKISNIPVRTDSLKVVTSVPGGEVKEIGLIEPESGMPVGGLKIVESNISPADSGKPENLFDEQDKIELSPSFRTSTYFDEIYFARTGYEYINRIEPYENTHPPLGKIFIGLGMAAFGVNPFGWRVMGVLFGAALIPAVYLFGKKILGKETLALCAAFLITFDFMHFTHARIATIDVFAVFFTVMMYYFMVDYYTNKSYEVGFKKSLKPLFLSGLFFGLGAAVKWVCLYAGGGLALLFFLAKYSEYKDYKAMKSRKPREVPWLKDFVPVYLVRTCMYSALFFVIIPGAIYLLSYVPFMLIPGPGHGLKDVFLNQYYMYNYHSKLVATHPFSSRWWEWPLIIRPVWLYMGVNLPAGKASSIVTMGNPAIWWAGIPAFFAAIAVALKKKDRKFTVIITAIIFQYLPWVLVPRLTFIYHFFTVLPFMILAIVYVLENITSNYPSTRLLIPVYLSSAALLFVVFYPVLAGMEVSKDYIEHLKWLKSWVF